VNWRRLHFGYEGGTKAEVPLVLKESIAGRALDLGKPD
jgi:hypothetical protein